MKSLGSKKTAILFAVCVSLLGGCAQNPERTGVYTEITPAAAQTDDDRSAGEGIDFVETQGISCADISNAILESVELSSMAEVEADRLAMYLDLSLPEGCDFSMYISGSGGFADEIFVVNAADADIAEIKTAAEKRIESRKKDFEGYNPDEFDKLSDYYSSEKNGYFIYAVTSDNASCESIFENYVK